jgi:hypothetical protein
MFAVSDTNFIFLMPRLFQFLSRSIYNIGSFLMSIYSLILISSLKFSALLYWKKRENTKKLTNPSLSVVVWQSSLLLLKIILCSSKILFCAVARFWYCFQNNCQNLEKNIARIFKVFSSASEFIHWVLCVSLASIGSPVPRWYRTLFKWSQWVF